MTASRPIALALVPVLVAACAGATDAGCPNDRPSWARPADASVSFVVLPNVVAIEPNGATRWNGDLIPLKEMLRRLSKIRELEPVPQTILSADKAALCHLVDRIRTEMEIRIGCKDGRCAEQE